MRGPEEMCEPQMQTSLSGVSGDRALNKSVDFSEYMWMVEEGIEDFDKQCEEEFWEECWMEEAYEDMLEEEEVLSTQYYILPQAGNDDEEVQECYPPLLFDLQLHMHNLNVNASTTTAVGGEVGTQRGNEDNAQDSAQHLPGSSLNPEAAVFIPRSATPPPADR